MKYITTFFLIFFLTISLQSKNKLEKFATDYSKSIVKIRYNYSFNFVFTPTYYESTGFAIGDGSLVVTALKNLPKAEAISIYKKNDTVPTPAWVIAKDTLRDICLLKTESPTFEPITLSEEPLKQAQDLVLIGWLADKMKTNNYVITEGIISSSVRDTVVQTSAPLNYGMEGGAALNMEGKLIGLVTGKDKSEYEKTGFFVRNEFINDLVDSSKSETYQLDTNETEFQYHENLSAYKNFAVAATHIYKDLKPAEADEIGEGLENFISLNEKSDSFEKNARTYSNLAYAYLLNIYIDAINIRNDDTEDNSKKFSSYLNYAHETADSSYQNYLKVATVTPAIFFKSSWEEEDEYNYYDFYSKYFRRSWEYFIDQSREKEKRTKDFNRWLKYGSTPRELDKAIGAFKNQRGPGIQDRTKVKSMGNFLLPGPISVMNATELITDPYRNFKNVIPISNYFIIGYSVSSYGIRIGFQNYQRPLNRVLIPENLQETLGGEQSLILGAMFYEVFEANFFLTSEELYYSKLFEFNMFINRPSDIKGLTDYYLVGSINLYDGLGKIGGNQESSLLDGEATTFGLGLGIRFYDNYYIRTIMTVGELNSRFNTLNIGLEAYY